MRNQTPRMTHRPCRLGGSRIARPAGVVALLLVAASAGAQTWTPSARTGSNFVGAGPFGPTFMQIHNTFNTPNPTHDNISVLSPTSTVPFASAAANLDAQPSPRGMYLSITGEGIRGPIPCPSGCSSSTFSNATQSDQWRFTLNQRTCYELRAGVSFFSDAGPTVGQGVQFLFEPGGSSVVISQGTLTATGDQQLSRTGTLEPGNYLVTVTGQADGNGAPRTSRYHHWISITLGSPVLVSEPADVSVCAGDAASFSVATASSGLFTYQWQIQAAPGVWATLGSDPLPLPCGGSAHATPPDQATTSIGVSACAGVTQYLVRCIVSSACGSSTSREATLALLAPVACCPADFNHDGNLNPDDLGDFITCYFSSPACAEADFNADGVVNADDLGDLITAYFTGCS